MYICPSYAVSKPSAPRVGIWHGSAEIRTVDHGECPGAGAARSQSSCRQFATGCLVRDSGETTTHSHHPRKKETPPVRNRSSPCARSSWRARPCGVPNPSSQSLMADRGTPWSDNDRTAPSPADIRATPITLPSTSSAGPSESPEHTPSRRGTPSIEARTASAVTPASGRAPG